MKSTESNILGLAIESSCDETAVAIIQNEHDVLSNQVASQIETHRKFGGVVPEVASRNHIIKINDVIQAALAEAKVGLTDLSYVAVTYGPGLVGALLVGLSQAKGLAYGLDIPLIGVHHIAGHIAANYIAHPQLEPPFLALVVSGGHTHLIQVESKINYHLLGRTRDDAVGEAYDKVARSLGLDYPGGPAIQEAAKGHQATIDFPQSFLEEGSLDFSFSGVKSAVLNYLNEHKMKNLPIHIGEVAQSFQYAVNRVLIEKAMLAAHQHQLDTLVLAGGVSANLDLRQSFEKRCQQEDIRLFYPPLELCTDNAAMIGAAGYHLFQAGQIADFSLNAKPSQSIEAFINSQIEIK